MGTSKYTEEQKQAAVFRVFRGETIKAAAKASDMTPGRLGALVQFKKYVDAFLVISKACPFCPPETGNALAIEDGGGGYLVWCGECWATGPTRPTKAAAMQAWNTRTKDES